jgi:hypothetical protein
MGDGVGTGRRRLGRCEREQGGRECGERKDAETEGRQGGNVLLDEPIEQQEVPP